MDLAVTPERGSGILQTFDQVSRSHPDRLALVAGGKALTYGEAGLTVAGLAGGLAHLGVAKGDRVAIMLPNVPEFVLSAYAAWRLGAVQVSINTMYKERETAHLLVDSGARVVITTPQLLPLVRISEQGAPFEHVIVLGGDADRDRVLPFHAVERMGRPVPESVALEAGDLAVIAYTSGTTGVPKGARLTHGNYRFQLETYRTYFGLDERHSSLVATPLFLQAIFLLGPVLAHHLGAAAIVQDRFEAREYARLIKAHRIGLLGAAVPPMFFDLARLGTDELDMSSVQYAFLGGSAISPGLRAEFERKFGFRLSYSYGGTETTGHMTADPPGGARKQDSPGLPLPGHEMKVVDPVGRALPSGEIGEICSRGPNVMDAYWNRPDATAAALRDGWFHSGDLGYLDADGYLFIVDRMQDTINRGGFKVFPTEIEKVLLGDPRVRECAVIGVPHPRLGEVPKAFVVLEPGASATAGELIDLTRTELARYKVLEGVEFRSTLPRSPLGKVLRRELRREVREKAEA